jgi:cytochrome c553
MKRLLKWLAGLVGIVLLAAIGLFTFAWFKTEQELGRKYVVADPPLVIPTDAAALARGAHLFTVMGCGECHGADGSGKLVVDAGPVGRMVAPNITPAALVPRYDADAIAAAIRHGVRADGTPLRFMPAGDFHGMSDADTAALVAHVQHLAPSTNDPGPFVVKPLGRVLALLGKLHLTPAASLDHTPRTRTAPPPGPTAEYGAYLAQACVGCHGTDFGGQHVPGTPPEFPDSANLTPHPAALGPWTLDDFKAALRTGKRPDGRQLDPFMPWPAYSKMSDDEMAAIFAHLRSLPAKAPRK